MLSIAICDDEIMERSRMAQQIRKILSEKKTACSIREFASGRALLKNAEDFDIIFLDILMNDLDGMDTARKLRDKEYEGILVFVSSSREYLLEAYDVEAYYYFIKPVDEKKMQNLLERIIRKTEKSSRDFIVVNKERQCQKLLLDHVYYFEIRGRTIEAHTKERIFIYYEQIGNLEKNLQGKGFCRCHKSYLVNLRYVNSYTRQELILDSGEKIMIARRRYEQVCKEILDYMRRHGGIDP